MKTQQIKDERPEAYNSHPSLLLALFCAELLTQKFHIQENLKNVLRKLLQQDDSGRQ